MDQDAWQKKNALRLLREQKPTTTSLAQEMYQIIADQPGGPGAASAAPPNAVTARAKQALQAVPEAPPGARQYSVVKRGLPAQVVSPIQVESAPLPGLASTSEPATAQQINNYLQGRGGLAPALPSPGKQREGWSPKPGSTEQAIQKADQQDRGTEEPHGSGRNRPYMLKADLGDVEPDLHAIGPGGGGSSDFFGQVQGSVIGTTVTVSLYPAGSTGAAGTAVQVQIIGMLASEAIPAGTWIGGIQAFTDANGNTFYQAIVPVWLS